MTHKFFSICRSTAVLLLTLSLLAFSALAAEVPCESATATGSYRHPVTNAIQDSGGESSEALGQSMVTSVVDPQALVETAPDGQLYLTMRFHLMSNISGTKFSVQKSGDSAWTQVQPETTAKGDDSADLRIPIPAKNAIVQAECFVDAMGRDVVFYVTLNGFTSGNAGNFVRMEDSEAPSKSAGTENSTGSGGAVIGDNVVGLVTGGGTPSDKSSEANNEIAKNGDNVQEVVISGSVWVMFFILVFCAQLLACLCFWGIKTLVCRHLHGRRQPLLSPDEPEQENSEFPEDLWDENWEESEHEAH